MDAVQTCSKCGAAKDETEFSLRGTIRRRQCKSCHSAQQAANYAAKRDEKLAQKAEYYAANREAKKEGARKYHRANKEARAASAKLYREKNKDKLKSKRLEREYGITADAWEFIFAEQGHRCAACRDTSPGKGLSTGSGWHVDHDHLTGVTRGILCSRCNLTLGHSKESPARLLACAAYVHKHHPERATATYE